MALALLSHCTGTERREHQTRHGWYQMGKEDGNLVRAVRSCLLSVFRSG